PTSWLELVTGVVNRAENLTKAPSPGSYLTPTTENIWADAFAAALVDSLAFWFDCVTVPPLFTLVVTLLGFML
ncbi:hypothetical protein LCGC14_2916810, partial [marine sediment metagenome]